ncbi:ABC transporter substrate-binding protein [Streptomyces decoyicus]|uniref:ABC transporter substrate-binding protein n=1 Tax=Streptomyces decoyicus TaxID=249567 RepID=UPI0006620AC4|nr:ABC transporter substrate-binding protein [Streptomyces decoyicus]KOG39595.1 ABC transporter substrate-binding protein [Streptomyces decoyicus]QZY14194.1 ABC transporter substrate-binding protein [Streptomyces decoyicus]
MTTLNASTRRNFLTLLGLSAVAVSCGTTANGASSGKGQTKTLRYQGWAGQVTLPELAEDLGYLKDVKLKWVGNTTSGPQDIQSTATGQTDFGGAFNGAVVKLAANKAPVKAVISYYGSDKDAYNGYYVLDDSPIRSARDLIGKKVGMNTLGAHAEALLDIYLERGGLSPGQAGKVEPLVVPPVNTEQSLRQRQIEVAVLGGILRDKALAKGGIRRLFTDYELLGAFSAGTYVIADRFLQQNPDTARTFVTAVGRAIEWSRSTPREEVVARMTDIVKKRGRNEEVAPLRYWKSYGVVETAGRIKGKELQLWIDWLAKRGDIEKSQVTLSELYTNEFNAHSGGGAGLPSAASSSTPSSSAPSSPSSPSLSASPSKSGR